MKKTLLTTGCLAIAAFANAQIKGPSSSQTPYVLPSATGVVTTSILTVGDAINGYKMAGIPDGMGAFDNGDGTFTVVMNHELGSGSGTTRAHGSIGSFVSKWIIRKSDLTVLNGSDLMQRVKLYDPITSTYTTYYASNPSASAAFNRFCSADLPAVSAYYNSKTGKGTMSRIFMDGEEGGTEGRAMAHVVTGPEAGTSYELPYVGKLAFENVVARPYESDTTVAAGLDDGTGGQVYFYIGTKTATGSEIEKAGLANGKVYGLAVTGLVSELNASVPTPGTAFTLADMGQVQSMTGATLNTNSVTAGVTTFMRPEDGAWDPNHPEDFYFLTTNAFASPSRLWRARFNNVANPAAGGTITALLDGTEGQKMLDNLTVDNWGHILMVEDVGGNAHIGKVWQYTIATDDFKQISTHDTARFLTGGTKFLTQDEEASGIIDVQEILGAGMFLCVDQAHYSTTTELAEGGQFFAIYNPDSYNANPEVSVESNSTNIIKGDASPSTADNTDFGNINVGTNVTKTFTIKNAGPAALAVSGITISGTNASEFTLVTPPTFPLSIAAGASQIITVQFAPTAVGLRTAKVNVANNDFDEKSFDFAIQGVALNAVGINAVDGSSFVKLFPNPTGNATTVSIMLKKADRVTVSLIDVNGKEVIPSQENNFNAGEQHVVLNTTAVSNGIYFVQISAGSLVTRTRLVVAH